MNFCLENILYIAAISFQLSGALTLIVFHLRTSRKSIIETFQHKTLIQLDGETKEIGDISGAIKDRFKIAYLNVTAFIQLMIGYVLGIFGENKGDKFDNLLLVLISTILLLFFATKILTFLLKQPKVVKKVTLEELEKYGVEPDIQTLSKEDIDKLLDENL